MAREEFILTIVTIGTQLAILYYGWTVIRENKRLWRTLDGEYSEMKLIVAY